MGENEHYNTHEFMYIKNYAFSTSLYIFALDSLFSCLYKLNFTSCLSS